MDSNKARAILGTNSKVLVTGASGFLGARLVHKLCEIGYRDIRCLVRSNTSVHKLSEIASGFPQANLEIMEGNLLRHEDAKKAVGGIDMIFHCAAGKGGPLAAMYMNTVVATRNLLEAAVKSKNLKRFVHISSFSVYGTADLKQNIKIDEDSPLEGNLKERRDGYAYVKLKQELLVRQYQKKFNLPVVIVRPGVVYGPGGDEISRRVGMRLLGLFLNIGRNNLLPLSYVDNCAEAIILAGSVPGIEGEIINIHDNDLRTCNEFLKKYRKEVKPIKVIKVPYSLFWLFSWMVESYARYSKEQIPAILSRYMTAAIWKKRKFDNSKLVNLLGWKQTIPTNEGLARHYQYFRDMYSSQKG